MMTSHRSWRFRGGRLLSLPYSMDVNEGWNLRFNIEAEEFVLSARDQFDRLYREGAESPRDVAGTSSLYLRAAASDRASRSAPVLHPRPCGVWQATGIEIAEWYEAHGIWLGGPGLIDAGALPREGIIPSTSHRPCRRARA